MTACEVAGEEVARAGRGGGKGWRLGRVKKARVGLRTMGEKVGSLNSLRK